MTPLLLSLLFLTAEPQSLAGRVVGISDGDTITVLIDGTQVKIRLVGIDAPEKGQPFGTKSKERLAELVHEKEVRIETSGKDRYGRTLGTVFVGETNVNNEMVKSGFAWRYVRYSKDKELIRLEDEARIAKRGLWGGSETPIPPWEWRRQKKVIH